MTHFAAGFVGFTAGWLAATLVADFKLMLEREKYREALMRAHQVRFEDDPFYDPGNWGERL